MSASPGRADIMKQMHADDMQLVRVFAATGSEEAFATLARRHVNLVYSVALRRLGNSHEAEEVTQAVFIILAQKAGSLRPGTVLSGWLYQAAQMTSANFQRAAARRQRREQEAFMQFAEQSGPDTSWHRLSPHLEEAMSRLRPKERDAVVLRFFEDRTVREVADALGLREAAAQKRLDRATDKLRRFFARRGIQISSMALLASIGAHAVHAAPAELASTVAAGATLKGVASGSMVTLVKTTLKIMAWTKTKTAIIAIAAVLLTAGAGLVAVKTVTAAPAPGAEAWRTQDLDERLLDQAAPQVRVLPTKFSSGRSRMVRSGATLASRRVAGIRVTVADMFRQASGENRTRMLFATPELNDGFYDFIASVPAARQALQLALKKELGLVGRKEMRVTDVLLLKVRVPNAAGLKRNPASGNSHTTSNNGRIILVDVSLAELAMTLEDELLVPVVDRTGVAGNFDITITTDGQGDYPTALKRAVLEQVGLELVPAREQIQMFVVDKQK
jgi:uncharacterized protein (TIGR03435 family)